MPNRTPLIVGALSILLLASCGSKAPAAADDNNVTAEGTAPENAGVTDPAAPGGPANGSVDPVPPPDAVSHPNGYLPPAPDEPDPASVNSSGPDASPAPATEDEYMRNRQSGR
jgi:hypothetical protein